MAVTPANMWCMRRTPCQMIYVYVYISPCRMIYVIYGRSRLIYILITAGLIYTVSLNPDVPATVTAHPSLGISNSYTGVGPTPSLRAFLLYGDNLRDDKEDLSTAADIALTCTPAHSYTNRPTLTHSCSPSRWHTFTHTHLHGGSITQGSPLQHHGMFAEHCKVP